MIQIITHAGHLRGESDVWQELLARGADSILLRKPGWNEADYQALLEQTAPGCYRYITIAGYAGLCARFGLQGVHFGELARSSLTPETIQDYRRRGWRLSTSIHSTDTLTLVSDHWDQVLLGPVFDSISKPGYRAAFEEGFTLSKNGYAGRVLALGGVNHTTAARARMMQFDGIALLGALWEQPQQAIENFTRIRDIWKGTALM